MSDLATARRLSSYVDRVCERHAQWLETYLTRLDSPPDFSVWRQLVAEDAVNAGDMERFKSCLRVHRTRLQMHLIYRHVLRLAHCDETIASASTMADLFVGVAVDWVESYLEKEGRFGVPYGAEDGSRQRLVVFALGKLGANELNLSSDIDLVLTYPQAGETDRGKTNQQYFMRAAQMLIDALDPVTVDGFVHRVDLRLRPYGESGPLAMHFDAFEAYFETQGRDWERYAFIKARPCAGDIVAGEDMLQRLRPFTYRRYLDFGAIESLRDMKSRIIRERHGDDDVKLGSGGIRDLEFSVQVLQMIWGGREAELQEPRLISVLPELNRLGHVSDEDTHEMMAAYRFLRDAEHSVQALADEQTQKLPSDQANRSAVAEMMGFSDFAGFMSALDEHRQRVRRFFDAAVAPVESVEQKIPWDEMGAFELAAADIGESDRCAEQLASLKAARDRKSVAVEGRERLDELMPHVLKDLEGRTDAGLILSRLVPMLKAILRRSAYLVLLRENPQAREALVELLARSQWLADQVRERPMQLDVLLDDRGLDVLPERARLAEELHTRMNSVREEGEERVLDVLREFRRHHAFAVAVAELRGHLPIMKVSDYYTYLAEVLLEEALDVAWRGCDGPEERPFIIVGYGKLGGLELGPNSDLDLVFIHGFESPQPQFLHRLARRLMHVLTAPTYNGVLYEIDMRLRPSGNAGTMISGLEAFVEYQRRQAWTWEAQALVRARAVAGDAQLAGRFEAVRRELICQPRDMQALKDDVLNMRQRLAAHHGDGSDLKQGSGGIVDIEFMVQYLTLAHAHSHPRLAQFSDNVRILQTAGEEGVLDERTTGALTDAYLALRAEAHRFALDLPNPERAKIVLEQHRELVRGAWQSLFG